MRTSYIIEHLSIAKELAEADGKVFLTYLIEMAIGAARSPSSKRPKDRLAA